MELAILIGLQASGKSTFFRVKLAPTHQQISKDLLQNHKHRQRRQMELLNVALAAGQSVAIDNTNPSIEVRRVLIQCGQQYGAEIVGYYFQSQLQACLQRNQQRQGRARVPDVGVYATAKQLALPSYSEGFQRLFYVRSPPTTNSSCDRGQSR